MAHGGDDFEMQDWIGNEQQSEDWSETSFSNNLNDTADFEQAVQQRLDRPPDPQLAQREIVNEKNMDYIEKLTQGTDWKFTKEGLIKLAQVNWRQAGEDMEFKFNDKWVRVTQSKGTKFLAYSSIKAKSSGLADWLKSLTETGVVSKSHKTLKIDVNKIPSLIDASPQDLENAGLPRDHQWVREIEGVQKETQNIAKLKDHNHKLTDKVERLEREKQKLAGEIREAKTNDEITRLEQSFDDLVDEINYERNNQSVVQSEYESQVSRVKRFWRKLLANPDSDVSLKDRIKLLFKSEGFTIAAVITAITMTFATIGLAISRATSPTPSDPDGPDGPKPPGESIPDRIADGLKKFGNWLTEMAKKSSSFLPGIIGSIASFILSGTGSFVYMLSKHPMIVMLLTIAGIIYGLIRLNGGSVGGVGKRQYNRSLITNATLYKILAVGGAAGMFLLILKR